MKIKSNVIKFLEIFSIIFGIFISLLLLWNRLLRERLPKILDGNYEPNLKVIFLLLFFSSLLSFIIALKKILNISVEPKNKYIINLLEMKFVQKSFHYIYEYILKAPEHAGIWFFNSINIINYIRDFGSFIYEQDPRKYTKILVRSMYIIRIVVSLVFIIDVLVFNKFDYFYKVAILLLLPMLFKVFLFVIKDGSEFNRKYYLENYIVVVSNFETMTFDIDFHPSYKGEKSEWFFYQYSNNWLYFVSNCAFVDHIKDYEEKTKYYVVIFCSTMYLIGWLYIMLAFIR